LLSLTIGTGAAIVKLAIGAIGVVVEKYEYAQAKRPTARAAFIVLAAADFAMIAI
jgi:hypothetical protein